MALPLLKTESFTYQDYLKINDEKRYEITGGNLIMVPAPDSNHQFIESKLSFTLMNFISKKELGYIFFAPTDVILDDNNVVQPDLLYISKERESIIRKRGIFGSPDLVVEIISPSSKHRDIYQKKELYEKFGIKEYWLVDPANKDIEVLSLNENGKYELFSEGYLDEGGNKTVKSNILEGFEIDIEKLFYKTF